MVSQYNILFYLLITTFLISPVISIFIPFLLVPPTSPTRHQLIWGIGIPVDGAQPACTLGLVLKAQYFLPTTIDDLKPEYFYPTDERKINKRDLNCFNNNSINYVDNYGTKVEQWNNIKVIDKGVISLLEKQKTNSDETYLDDKKFREMWKSQRNMDTTRWKIYNILEGLAERHGYDGKHCVYRAICECAQAGFSYHSGIIAELFHIILTPSSSPDTLNDETRSYLNAEINGQQNEDCSKIYYKCEQSLLDMFTETFNPLDYLGVQ